MADFTIKNLYTQKKYEEAIKYASTIDKRENLSEWEYRYLSLCMYKLKRYEDCLTTYKEFHKKYPDSTLLDNTMGWSLFYAQILNFDFETGNRIHYLKQIDFILSHCDDSQYSPNNLVASVVIDNIFNCNFAVNINYELANKYLSKIDPLTLNTTEHEMEKDGRIIKTSSDREQWYIRKVKTLVELEKYEECLPYIDEAFNNIDKFHNDSFYWLRYRQAQCYVGLNNNDKAESILTELLKHFTHWCFYGLLFEISAAKNDTDKAIRYGSLCSLSDKSHRHRVTFYEKYASFLLFSGYTHESYLHYKLVEEIRKEEGWKNKILSEDFSYPENIQPLDKKAVLIELYSFWEREKERGIEYFEGIIDKVLPEGKSGFIRDENGNSYYFNVKDFVIKAKDLNNHVGNRVRYTIEERLDKKKMVMKPNAVQISFIK